MTGALLYFLNINLITILKILYILINFLTIWGSFKLGKRLGGIASGLVLAALFTLAPYRALLLFVRGALSEAFALSFFPWLILALTNLINQTGQKQSNHLLLFLSLSMIVLSHNLSALMFIPLSLIYVLLLNKKGNFEILITYLLAGLVTSFYTIPTLVEQNLTRVGAIFTDYFDYRLHFVYIRQLFWDNWGYGGSSWGTEDNISFFLGYAQLIALAVILFLIFRNFYRSYKNKTFKQFLSNKQLRNLLLVFGFFLLTLFLTLQKSQFCWSVLSPLAYLQFPWRWFGASFFFLATALSASLFLIKKALIRYLIVLILIFTSLSNLRYFRAEKMIDHPEVYYTDQAELIAGEISQTLPDYIPSQMAEQEVLAKFNQEHPQPIVWLETAEGAIEVLEAQLVKQQAHRQIWSLNLEQTQLINFKLANFPGWQAEVDGQSTEILTNPKLGNIQVNLDAGKHGIELVFRENPLRLITNYLSLFALIGFFIWLNHLKNRTTNHQT
jgi:hypothetical protein